MTVLVDEKFCPKCKQTKSLSEFHKASAAPDGLQWTCKPCKRKQNADWDAAHLERRRAYGVKWSRAHPELYRPKRLRHLYGLSLDDFDQLLASQDHHCASCGTSDPRGYGQFHVDHDHTCCPGKRSCGKCIRGLLCHKCNMILGLASDNPDHLHALVDYLSAHRKLGDE